MPKCRPQHEKAVMCHMEEMSALEELGSCMSYTALGCEFSVSEATIYIK